MTESNPDDQVKPAEGRAMTCHGRMTKSSSASPWRGQMTGSRPMPCLSYVYRRRFARVGALPTYVAMCLAAQLLNVGLKKSSFCRRTHTPTAPLAHPSVTRGRFFCHAFSSRPCRWSAFFAEGLTQPEGVAAGDMIVLVTIPQWNERPHCVRPLVSLGVTQMTLSECGTPVTHPRRRFDSVIWPRQGEALHGSRVCGGWRVVCGLRRVACGVWFAACGVWCVVCGGWRVVCGLRRVACGVWFVAGGEWCGRSARRKTC